MNNQKYAGSMLTSIQEWINQLDQAKTPEEVLKINNAFEEALKSGAFPGAKIRMRRVSDIHPETAPSSDPSLRELSVYIEDKGVLLSAFYGPKYELIGWSYFHSGDLPMSEIRKHMSNFKRYVRKVSRKEVLGGPLTDVEIYELVETRKDWMPDEDEPVVGRGPTRNEACERIITLHYPNKDPDDKKFVNELRKVHHRVYRRRWNKSG